MSKISRRAYGAKTSANSWEEIWEAGTYYERISESLESATSYAIFVGWQLDSRVPMPLDSRFPAKTRETLKNKVLRLCEEKPGLHIYFLIWDHAYFYTFEREFMQGRVWDELHERVHFVFDNRYPYGASHHEKVVVFDGTLAFCGGIDLCDERWDSPQHLFSDPRRSLDWREEHHGPYHDMAVRVTGPVCREIQSHIAARWQVLSTLPFPKPPDEQTHEIEPGHVVYLSRTLAKNDETSIVREIEFLTQALVAKAEHRIFMEGQYYWSEKFNDLLIAKIHESKRPLEIYIILADIQKLNSLTKMMAAHQFRLLSKLQIAAEIAGTKLVVAFPYVTCKRGRPPKSIYVHSKLILIDDRFLSIGSANIAARAFRVDTELNLTFEATTPAERNYLSDVAEKILSHWNLGDVRLNILDCQAELKRITTNHFWKRIIPWEVFFDPIIPWLYPFKRHYRHWATSQASTAFLFLLFAWAASVFTTLILIHLNAGPIPSDLVMWATIDAVLLSSAWVIPMPFVALSLFASAHLGADIGAAVSVSAFWSAASWSYMISRLVPDATYRLFRITSPDDLTKIRNPSLRSFSNLLSVLVDPRIGTRTKFISQGLNYVHLPWFILGTLILMPSALYLGDIFVGKWFHDANLQNAAPIAAGLALLWALASVVLRVARQSGTEKLR